MIIKNDALKLLAIFGTSCRTLGEKRIGNIRYICECVADGKDMELADFLAGFPEKYMAYKLLEIYAQKLKKGVIDYELVIKFFSGRDHMDFVEEQIQDWEALKGKMPKLFSDQFRIGHATLPVTITRKHPVFCGKYQRFPWRVNLRGLVAHPLSFNSSDPYFDIEVGKEYLVHFSTIIAPVSNEILFWIWNEHKESKKFQALLKRTDTIDYRKFWNLHEWTKEMLKECGF